MRTFSPIPTRGRKTRSLALPIVVCSVTLFCLVAPLFTPKAFAATSARESSLSCAQPPANANPDTLTASQLALYGFPPRLAGENHVLWEYLARHVKHHYCSMTSTGNTDYQPWGGYVANKGGYTFSSVLWHVPCIVRNTQAGHASFWTGVGGYGNSNLVQVGTESITYYPGGIQNFLYYAWVENVAYDNSEHYVFDVNCGDQMYGQVSNGINMYIEDITSGASSNQSYGPKANGNTSECIAENPNNGGQLLADFNSVYFFACFITTTGRPIGNDPHFSLNITTDNNHVLTSVGPLDSGHSNFTVTWKGYS